MNIVIIILIVIAAIIGVLLIVAIFTKADYSVEREIVINKPANQVFDYIKCLCNMDYYNKWVMQDPMARKDYKGEDGTEGFIYAWDSDNKGGKGEQQIMKIEDAKKIDIRITFEKPFAAVSDSYLETTPADQRTTLLKWGFDSKMPYPMNAVLIFIDMGEILGKDLDISLGNLKRILEDQA
ncbi:hypothetical protein A0256_06495 [Mucilaginibacter sp. PAMC 26640]|nr:hypothetical protein A0256_06495 [Mucilaginibacter sp. PAMC 26640]